MTQAQLYLDAVNKSEDLIEALDKDKLASTSLTRHNITMKKRTLQDAILRARMFDRQLAAPKKKNGFISSHERYLGR